MENIDSNLMTILSLSRGIGISITSLSTGIGMGLYGKIGKESTRNSFLRAQSTQGKTFLVVPTPILPYIHYALVCEFSGRERFHIIALGQ